MVVKLSVNSHRQIKKMCFSTLQLKGSDVPLANVLGISLAHAPRESQNQNFAPSMMLGGIGPFFPRSNTKSNHTYIISPQKIPKLRNSAVKVSSPEWTLNLCALWYQVGNRDNHAGPAVIAELLPCWHQLVQNAAASLARTRNYTGLVYKYIPLRLGILIIVMTFFKSII